MEFIKPFHLLLFLAIFQVNCQEKLLDVLPLIDAKVVYKDVKEAPSKSKIDLQANAQRLLIKLDNEIIQNGPLDDTHHFISGIYRFKVLWGPNDFKELHKLIECQLDLTLKNERYQYVISNFIVKEPDQVSQLEIYKMDHKKLQKYNKAFFERIDNEIKALVHNIEQSLIQ